MLLLDRAFCDVRHTTSAINLNHYSQAPVMGSGNLHLQIITLGINVREFSLSKKLFIAATAIFLYNIFFIFSFPLIGNNTVVFALLFCITVTWLCGIKFGLVFSILNTLESHILLYFINDGWGFFKNLGGFPGIFAFLFAIIFVGYFREIKSSSNSNYGRRRERRDNF